MQNVVLDTLRCATLKNAGLPPEQADAMAHVLRDALSEVATKEDLDRAADGVMSEIGRLDNRIDSLEQKLDVKFDALELKVDVKVDALERKLDALAGELRGLAGGLKFLGAVTLLMLATVFGFAFYDTVMASSFAPSDAAPVAPAPATGDDRAIPAQAGGEKDI